MKNKDRYCLRTIHPDFYLSNTPQIDGGFEMRLNLTYTATKKIIHREEEFIPMEETLLTGAWLGCMESLVSRTLEWLEEEEEKRI